jgi:hypothetical protein
MDNFAAYIPMGPGIEEAKRTVDLLSSVFFYEPSISHLIIVDDGACLSLLDQLSVPNSCTISVLVHPRPRNKLNGLGGLCAADLVALRFVSQQPDVRFIVKLDTDSLVIAPFSEKVEHAFALNPNAGILGVLGTSCNPVTRSFWFDRHVAQITTKAVALGLALDYLSQDDINLMLSWGISTDDQKRALRQLARILEPILHANFAGAHPQGGAYAVSKQLISQLSTVGVYEDPSLWLDLKIGEDQMMGILCALAGFQVMGFSNHYEPFGVQAVGLAYSPSLLADYGYSIIHSVKNDPHYSEAYIREFFRKLRN